MDEKYSQFKTIAEDCSLPEDECQSPHLKQDVCSLSDDLSTRVAILVKEIRSQSGLQQKELAKKAGVSKGFMTNVANGCSTSMPRVDMLAKLAAAIGKKLVIKLED